MVPSLLIVGLFFYLVPPFVETHWEQFLALAEIRNLVLIVNFILSFFGFFSVNLVMMGIYKAKHPFFEQYRVTNKPWPWEENPLAWNKLLKRTLVTVAINTGVITPIISLIDYFSPKLLLLYDVGSFPSRSQIAIQLLVCMILDDLTFFWSHRTLHTRWLYKHVHKKHHEYVTPVSIASHYAHPVEFVLGNILPFAMGPLVLSSQMHFFTRICWSVLRLTETCNGHCGYEFPWAPFSIVPFTGSAQYHGYHHTNNLGNFASFFTLWDTVFGTNRHYLRHLAKLKAQEKEERKDKSD